MLNFPGKKLRPTSPGHLDCGTLWVLCGSFGSSSLTWFCSLPVHIRKSKLDSCLPDSFNHQRPWWCLCPRESLCGVCLSPPATSTAQSRTYLPFHNQASPWRYSFSTFVLLLGVSDAHAADELEKSESCFQKPVYERCCSLSCQWVGAKNGVVGLLSK